MNKRIMWLTIYVLCFVVGFVLSPFKIKVFKTEQEQARIEVIKSEIERIGELEDYLNHIETKISYLEHRIKIDQMKHFQFPSSPSEVGVYLNYKNYNSNNSSISNNSNNPSTFN